MLAALGTLVLSVCALVTTVPALAEDGPKGQQAHILTPKPSPKPRINGANVFGVRPRRPFLFAIPATGKRPMSFAAEGLPPGLVLDEKSGRISGSTTTRGIHHVMLRIMSLLSNDEVLEVNQDPLGQQAGPVSKDTEYEVLAKDLEDGSKAVGLFNLALEASEVTVKWEDLDIQGKQTVRDLWRQEDIGGFQGKFGATVPGHGVVLVRITPARYTADTLECPVRSGFSLRIARRQLDKGKCPRHSLQDLFHRPQGGQGKSQAVARRLEHRCKEN